MKKVGPERIASLITDGSRNTALLRWLVSERYPNILKTSSILHSLNVLCLRVCEIPVIADLFSSAKLIIERFIESNKSHSRLQQLKAIVDANAIASTRFSKYHLCLKALLGNKQDIVHLHKESGLNLPTPLIEKIQDGLLWKEIEQSIAITEPLALLIKKAESSTFRLSDNFFHYVRLVFQVDRVMNHTNCALGILIKEKVNKCLMTGFVKYIDNSVTQLAALLDCRYRVSLSQEKMVHVLSFLRNYCSAIGSTDRNVDKIEKYFLDYCKAENYFPSRDPLETWQQDAEYYYLRRVAVLFFSVVTNSMSCEQTLSTMGWIESARRSSFTTANLVAFTKVYQDLRALDKKQNRATWSVATENLGQSAVDFIQKQAAEEEIDSLGANSLSEDVDLIGHLSAYFDGLQALSVMLDSDLSASPRRMSDEEYEKNCSRLLIKKPRTNQSDAIKID